MIGKSQEYIAYQGEVFTVEWYYDSKGKSEPFEYFFEMPIPQQAKVMALFQRIGDTGKIYDQTKFRFEGDGIYAFKPQPNRFLSCFAKDKKIILLHGFVKKQDKLPPKEKEKALKRKEDYEKRTKERAYYGI
jgi:phage-related protein